MYEQNSVQYFMPVPERIRDPWRIPPKPEIISPPKPEIITDEEEGGMEYPTIKKRDDKKRPWDAPTYILSIDETTLN